MREVPLWVMGAFVLREDPPAADVRERLDDHTWLLAWRAGDLGDAQRDEALDAAIGRMLPALRSAERSQMTIGPGREHDGMLLGWTASSLAARVRRGRWTACPRMSLRLRGDLRRLAERVGPAEVIARCHPRDADAWSRWGLALNRKLLGAEAVPVLRRALRRAGGELRIATLRRLSDAYLMVGRHGAAARLAREAIAGARALPNPDNLVRANYSLANALYQGGSAGEATALFEAVAEEAGRLGGALRVLALRATRGLMSAYEHLGDYAEAERIGLRATAGLAAPATLGAGGPVEAPTEIAPDEAWDYANLYSMWGESAFNEGRFAEARARYQMMHAIARRHDLASEERRARYCLGWVALMVGDLDLAEAYCRPVLPELIAEGRSFLAVGAWVLAEICLAQGNAAEAEEVLLHTEAALDAGMAGNAGTRGRSNYLTWCARSLRARLLRRRGQLEAALISAEEGVDAVERDRRAARGAWASPHFIDNKVPVYGLAAELAAALGDWTRALRHVEAAGTRAVRERARDVGLLPPPSFASLIRGAESLAAAGADGLTLFLGPTDLLIFHHGCTGGRVRLEGAAARVRSLALQIEQALRDNGPVESLLATLGRTLGAPLASLAETSRPLVVFPHGCLRAVPWDLVPIGGAPLHARRPCVEALSLELLERRLAPSTAPAVVLGPGLERRDTDLLRARWPGLTPAATPAATAADVLGSLGRQWTLLVAHGTPRDIAVADGALTSLAILEHDIPGGVVLLGSCSTANASASAADPLDVVAPALLASGADTVVAPTVAVQAREGVLFLAELAGRLEQGAPLLSAYHASRAAVAARVGSMTALAPFRIMTRDLGILQKGGDN